MLFQQQCLQSQELVAKVVQEVECQAQQGQTVVRWLHVLLWFCLSLSLCLCVLCSDCVWEIWVAAEDVAGETTVSSIDSMWSHPPLPMVAASVEDWLLVHDEHTWCLVPPSRYHNLGNDCDFVCKVFNTSRSAKTPPFSS